MTKEERTSQIVEMLKQENGLPVQIIADRLGVSHMTVRRDLETLVEQELVRLIHGGVLLNPDVFSVSRGGTYSLIAAGSVHAHEKRLIGARAADLIEPNDTVIIDIGSTTEWIARYLPENRGLTVLSYGLNIVTETANRAGCTSVFGGGVLRPDTLMFDSPEARQLVSRYRANKAFISAAGVHSELGVTCVNAYEREMKLIALESSATAILVVDSSKFDVVRPEYFAEVAAFSFVITDSGLTDEYRRDLEACGTQVIIA
jgi:DeoR family deoxyribose operon repressor